MSSGVNNNIIIIIIIILIIIFSASVMFFYVTVLSMRRQGPTLQVNIYSNRSIFFANPAGSFYQQ